MTSKILVVDDDQQILKVLQTMIQLIKPDHEIFTASDCSSANNLLAQHNFDVVICDFQLPDGEGTCILENVYPQTFTIGISGAENITQFKQKCHHFLPKPFEFKEIKTILESHY